MNREQRIFFIVADLKHSWQNSLCLEHKSDRRAGDLQSGGSLSDVEAGQISLVAWPFCHGSTSATEPNKCQDEFK